MTPRETLRSVSLGRLGFGAVGLLLPGLVARLLLGREESPGARFVARLWGSRELALGMATLYELDRAVPDRRVVQLNAFADGADAVAGLVARSIPWRTRLATVGGGLAAAAVSVQLLRELETT